MRIGKGKVFLLLDRAKYWITHLQFFMILYLFLVESFWKVYFGIPLIYWFILGVIVLIIITIYDFLYILDSYQSAYTQKNPIFMDIIDRLERIERKIK